MKKIIRTTWISISILLFASFCSAQSWEQLGSDINGDAIDFLGSSLSLSDDAQTLAVGAPLHTIIDNGSFEYERGKVEVYVWSDGAGNWISKGDVIFGDNDYDHLGSAVSLAADGNTLAVSMPGNDDAGSDAGQVRVYSWSGNTWTQMGQPINGTNTGEEFGATVFLSGDGNVLAIGNPQNSTNGTDAGQVTVYAWSGSDWEARGGALNGSTSGDEFGTAIEMSEDGSIIAIGAPYNVANSSSTEPGYANVYTWDGASWNQRGSTLTGEDEGDFFGQSVSLNADGDIAAIGAPWNSGEPGWKSGHVRVFEWDGSSWVQLGADIDGEEFEDLSGTAVSLSASGQTVAIGAPWNGLGGHARVYKWDNGAWVQKGEDMDGENFSDDFGRVLSLSGDGSILAVAAPDHGVNGTGSGQVQVYDGTTLSVSTNQSYPGFAKAFPNPIPASGEFHLVLDKEYKEVYLRIYQANGSLVGTQAYHSVTSIEVSLEDLAGGFYLFSVETDEGTFATLKAIKQ